MILFFCACVKSMTVEHHYHFFCYHRDSILILVSELFVEEAFNKFEAQCLRVVGYLVDHHLQDDTKCIVFSIVKHFTRTTKNFVFFLGERPAANLLVLENVAETNNLIKNVTNETTQLLHLIINSDISLSVLEGTFNNKLQKFFW